MVGFGGGLCAAAGAVAVVELAGAPRVPCEDLLSEAAVAWAVAAAVGGGSVLVVAAALLGAVALAAWVCGEFGAAWVGAGLLGSGGHQPDSRTAMVMEAAAMP